MHRHVERFARALDTPSLMLEGPVESDGVYVDGEELRVRPAVALVACPRADEGCLRGTTTCVHFDRPRHRTTVRGSGEYVDEDVHVNPCESHGSLLRPELSPPRGG